MPTSTDLALGQRITLQGRGPVLPMNLPAPHLITHGVVVGMTGSGKTGLVTVLAEEALRAGVPTLILDVKGDLPNLLLTLPSFEPEALAPWLEEGEASADARAAVERIASERRQGLEQAGVDLETLRRFRASTDIRVITPGSSAGEPLHVLSALERRSAHWDTDRESARAAVGASLSILMRMLGRDPDPAKSREHVLLAVLAERRFLAGLPCSLDTLVDDVLEPPIERIGALPVDTFLSRTERRALASAINTLLASPTLLSWRDGIALDVGAWMTPRNERTPAVIVSVAHLDEEERALVLGLVLQEVLSWVRSLSGSRRLRALVLFDEVYGYLPPHPANPPTKRPIVSLLKQARGYGVGVVIATQNPMDLDYRAIGNAGVWCIGRLQTEADRARLVDGMADADVATGGGTRLAARELDGILKRLTPRWFVVRDAYTEAPVLLRPRQTMSLLRGPMTRGELSRAIAANRSEVVAGGGG